MGRDQQSLKFLLRQWEVAVDFRWWLAWLFGWHWLEFPPDPGIYTMFNMEIIHSGHITVYLIKLCVLKLDRLHTKQRRKSLKSIQGSFSHSFILVVALHWSLQLYLETTRDHGQRLGSCQWSWYNSSTLSA